MPEPSDTPNPPRQLAAPLPALPRAAPPGWLARTWPRLDGHAPKSAVLGAAVTGLVAAVVLVFNRPGVGWSAVAVATAGTALLTRRGSGRRPEPRTRRFERLGWGVAALLLMGVGTVRDSGGLFFWCLCAAFACGSVALIGGRTLAGLAAGGCALPLAALRALPWWATGARHLRRGGSAVRVLRTVAVSAGLVALFGLLFVTADPEFQRLLSAALPAVRGGEVGRGVFALLLCGGLAAGAAYLAAGTPVFDAVRPVPHRPARRTEWIVPLALLDLLFLAFVLVQLETLFGGGALVLRTTGLTYAQYARSGFWQLLIIAALSLVVIAVAAHLAPRATAADRSVVRVLLGALAVLTLVVVASALVRIHAYSDAYGFTRERLAVWVVEAWLALVFLLVLAAGVRLRAGWLPRAMAATAVLALLGTATVDPDRYIADHNVRRYADTGRIDVAYLSRLSADALPALVRLPAGVRECAVAAIEARLAAGGDDWRSWNLSRARARALAGNPDADPDRCFQA